MSSRLDVSPHLPGVHDWYNRRATHGKADTWFQYCLSLLGHERLHEASMLSLGCNDGGLERSLSMLGTFRQMDAIDPSEAQIEKARKEAVARGISNLEYRVGDLNEVALPRAAYDAVWLNMTLGGVGNLEHLIGQIATTLKPDGFLFANEYIGASRFATRRAQREAVMAAFALVPRRIRGSDELVLPGPDGIEGGWAHRTGEIVGILRQYFEFDEFNPICSSIVQFILNPLRDRFEAETKSAAAVREMLFGIEELLVDSGELPADYALIVARPKSGNRP